MIPLWLGKIAAKQIIKAVKHKIDLKKIDKYVNKPNELDIQVRQMQKTIRKQGKTIEELEKSNAILKRDSHPPIFTKRGYDNILRRLKKLEKKEK